MITRAEFDAMGQQVKARMERRASGGASMMERMLEKSDTNKDGKISLAEMQQSALGRFDRMDLNHDGTVNPQERQQLREAKKAKPSKG